MLYRTLPRDPAVLIGVSLSLLLTAVGACLGVARRNGRVGLRDRVSGNDSVGDRESDAPSAFTPNVRGDLRRTVFPDPDNGRVGAGRRRRGDQVRPILLRVKFDRGGPRR